ncbi:hypothetical protein DESC_350043 [Desulfosarcina cetonica]|nr:hypothetical protein DESC_350043 [Desulfosarcina cetonica]
MGGGFDEGMVQRPDAHGAYCDRHHGERFLFSPDHEMDRIDSLWISRQRRVAGSLWRGADGYLGDSCAACRNA